MPEWEADDFDENGELKDWPADATPAPAAGTPEPMFGDCGNCGLPYEQHVAIGHEKPTPHFYACRGFVARPAETPPDALFCVGCGLQRGTDYPKEPTVQLRDDHFARCADCEKKRTAPAATTPAYYAEHPALDYPAAARSVALNLDDFCDRELRYPDMIADAARKAAAALTAERARAERAEADRDALVAGIRRVLDCPCLSGASCDELDRLRATLGGGA